MFMEEILGVFGTFILTEKTGCFSHINTNAKSKRLVYMSDEKIEKGIITSRRKVFEIGNSKAVTLSKKWLDIQTWLGKEVTELISVGSEVMVLAPPDKEEKAREVLRKIEE